MSLALTIFGIGAKNRASNFCYGLLRQVRGTGEYPAFSLPRSAILNGETRLVIGESSVELSVWRFLIDGASEETIQSQIKEGRFRIPDECPIEPGAFLEGELFNPSLVPERGSRFVCHGTGALWSRGFVLKDGATKILRYLSDAAGRPEVGEELDLILGEIDDEIGIASRIRDTRRIAVIETLWRARPGRRPAVLGAALVKAELNAPVPRRELRLYRDAAPLAQPLRAHIKLFSFDNITQERLIDFPAGKGETLIEASTHITRFSFAVFDLDSGELLDQYEDSFCQGVNFSMAARWAATDILPKPFKGAPDSADLEERERVRTATFRGPSGGDRAGGFDTLLFNQQIFELLVGSRLWRGESRWFSVGSEPQIEVIRWIKQRLETPGVRAAFLIDPYLGSVALSRVIVRHGNESIALSVAVSPASGNPDAKDLNTEVSSDIHISTLKATAEELSAKLCGKIQIFHLQRAEGRRQAFHDRYFGLIGSDGVPRVYQLSNSLNKAAGDWPFSALEFDRITAWKVAAYVRDLLQGDDRGRSLVVEKIWEGQGSFQMPATNQQSGGQTAHQQPDPLVVFRQAVWQTYLLVHDLVELKRVPPGSTEVNNVLDRLIAAWPPTDQPPSILAKIIVDGVHTREQHAAAIADRLKELSKFETVFVQTRLPWISI